MKKESCRPKDGTRTPGGGASAEIYYLDEEGKAVEKEPAVQAIIRELDEHGNLVRETFGTINRS